MVDRSGRDERIETVAVLADPVRRRLYDAVLASVDGLSREQAAERAGVPVHSARARSRGAGRGFCTCGGGGGVCTHGWGEWGWRGVGGEHGRDAQTTRTG